MHTLRDDLRASLNSKGVELLPMPQVANRILALAFDPKSTSEQLADLIQLDPTLAGQVMRIANSPFYRPREQIETLQNAIVWLGTSEVQSLALSLAVRGQVFQAPGHEMDIDELWRESLATAIWGQMLAKLLRRDNDVAYLCGLLHAIGRVAVIRVLSRVEAQRRTVCDARSFSLLLDEFEPDCAREVASDWQLPDRVASAIVGWRGYQSLAVYRDDAVLTYAAKQLATASLHPTLMEGDFLSSNSVFTELKVDKSALQELLTRSEEVKTFVEGF